MDSDGRVPTSSSVTDIYTPAGPQSAYRGNTTDISFEKKGDLQPWHNAMRLIYNTPSLEMIVASAFAAPLVELTCDFSLILSLYSHQSGFGKSTGLKAGAISVGTSPAWHVDAR